MTVAFRSAATAINVSGTGSNSITVTKPAGTVDGDVMVLVTNTGLTTTTPPAGWTLLDGPRTSGSTNRSNLYTRVASSEGASYTVTTGGAATAISASIASFSGASRVNSWIPHDNGTFDPADTLGIVPTRTSLLYDVLTWQDTTIDTGTATQGTEAFDIGAFNTGSTTARGQVGYYRSTPTQAGEVSALNSINMTNSITGSILWEIAIEEAVPANESWAQTGNSVELNINGTWTDVSGDVQYADGIVITRGSSAEGGEVNPSLATFTLDNTSGNYSPQNPVGAYYGYLNYGIECRVAKAYGTVAMDTIGFDYVVNDNSKPVDRFRALSTSALNITGDIDIRVDVEPETWRQTQVLCAKYTTQVNFDGNDISSWRFWLDSDGALNFKWLTGLYTDYESVRSTAVVPSNLRQAVRVTVDVDNGAGGYTVTFYTAATLGGSYTQLGNTVIGSSTTALLPSTAPLTIGAVEPKIQAYSPLTYNLDVDEPYIPPFRGRIYGMSLLSGIAGTAVASPDFTAQLSGVRSFSDAQSNLWVGYNHAICSNRRYRHYGEVNSWPQPRDTTGLWAWVPVESTGVLQRLQQGEQPASSALYRYYANPSGVTQAESDTDGIFGATKPFFPRGYWPLEDSQDSTAVASGIDGGLPGTVKGSPSFAADSSFRASNAIVGMKSGSSLRLPVSGSVSNAFAVEFIMYAPSGITNGAIIMTIDTTGSDRFFRLIYDSTNSLTLNTIDADGTLIATSGPMAFTLVNRHVRICITAWTDDGFANVTAQLQSDEDGTFLGSASTGTIGRVTGISVAPQGTLNDVYLGHVAVFDGTRSSNSIVPFRGISGSTMPVNALDAHQGDFSVVRAERLVHDQGIVSYTIGSKGDLLGHQLPGDTTGLLRKIQDSDDGYVYEARNVSGLGYRTRASMYNAPPVLALSYAGNELSGNFLPIKNNLGIVNDVTVKRETGSSARFVQEEGPMSVNEPPNGVRRYTEEVELSLWKDSQCLPRAAWHVYVGTNNDLKLNQVTVALENLRNVGDANLITRFLMADIGDAMTIDDLPDKLMPDQMRQQIVGYAERFDQFQHEIVFNTAPGSAFVIARASAAGTSTTQSKADSLTTTLNEALDTTETGVDIAVTAGSAAWTTSGVDFDIVIGGERMTVLSNTGTTFTVTRSVNGVVKSHALDAQVRLFQPSNLAL